MIFDYTEPGILQIDMMAYIKTIFEDFPEEITRSSPTPASDHLFKIRDKDDASFLPEEQAQKFYRTVAQLLFLSCRARPDVATPV